MKLMMDERVKHRLIGLAVILSIAAIFTPAIIKKSNQRIDDNVSVSVKLPPKPQAPEVAMPSEKSMFETVKVAHVEIPEVSNEALDTTLAKAESLSQLNHIKEAVEPMVAKAKVEPVNISKQKPAVVASATQTLSRKVPVVAMKEKPMAKPAKPVTVAKQNKPAAPGALAKSSSLNKTTIKGQYAVQLATFSKQQNADALVARLRAKGYKAGYRKVVTAQGMVYKVIVGDGHPKEQARVLQQQLASVMQIRGFVVTTGVS
ncbi:SPOR domain-containing protein [Legionella jordanis]|uniref:Sporulation domain-containing protein n=2 Tax=Legionella jordanis TaxID=456 RepID=A0A0W0VAH5_9GAMM|nr:SPOR domain-containing protein [Legionella jordanis]KTD17106.1 Sporulation domain-containing protein [Legionella jordanis]RMX03238.1 SPOR domain-containing protein [Legionella jordanis]VEH12697.1 Sporulation domain-containing protein [Legionella jordanis]HAT8713154.1 SPOR domain-containing protein [Legionella jordanis]